MEEEAKKPKQHRHTIQRLKKLKQILGDTEEQRLALVADRFLKIIIIVYSFSLCLDSKSKIGKTISEFIKQFHVLEKRPNSVASSVRQFINGMKKYILAHKKENFEALMIKSREVSFDN